MKNLIEIRENQPVVSHRVIAEFTDNKAKNIVELIQTHKNSLEMFGVIPFETEKLNNTGRPVETYFLNEPQSTLLITFLRNSDIVIKFKVALVKEFYEMRNSLSGGLKPKLNYTPGKVAHVLHSNPNSSQDPQFIKTIKELYGSKVARKYFAPILNIDYEEQEVIVDDHEPDLEMKGFVKDCIDFDKNSFLSSKVLYKTYIQWSERQGIVDILTHIKFTLAFNETTKLSSKQKRFNGDRIRGYNIGLKI
jgi:phage regulator Rha-like protein